MQTIIHTTSDNPNDDIYLDNNQVDVVVVECDAADVLKQMHQSMFNKATTVVKIKLVHPETKKVCYFHISPVIDKGKPKLEVSCNGKGFPSGTITTFCKGEWKDA